MLQLPKNGQSRVLITEVQPLVNNGRYPVKRIINEPLHVKVTLIFDESVEPTAAVHFRYVGHKKWHTETLHATNTFNFSGTILPTKIGQIEYYIEAWVKSLGQQKIKKAFSTKTERYTLKVEPKIVEYSNWYQLFVHNTAPNGAGTFKTLAEKLPIFAQLGFSVLKLPHVHPTSTLNTKVKAELLTSQSRESEVADHKKVHPKFGSISDYKNLVKTARNKHNIEIAFNLVFTFDEAHPWLKKHPTWFSQNDGGIFTINWETEDWGKLWKAMYELVHFWIKSGVNVFTVHNPYNVPFVFWAWLIESIQRINSEVLFFADDTSGESQMKQLAKLGFSTGHTLFAWRNFKHELVGYTEYFAHHEDRNFYRPSFWPNTAELLPYSLQTKSESVYLTRLFLAATLSASYGVYGPAYENLESEANPGKEQYRHPEKVNVLDWNWEKRNKIRWLMQLLNTARAKHPALQQNKNYQTLALENERLLAFIKWKEDDTMIGVVNLDAHNRQEGWLQLPLNLLGAQNNFEYTVHDLITDAVYIWTKEWNYVALDPGMPFHLFKLTRKNA